jgi:hypothetical protein
MMPSAIMSPTTAEVTTITEMTATIPHIIPLITPVFTTVIPPVLPLFLPILTAIS